MFLFIFILFLFLIIFIIIFDYSYFNSYFYLFTSISLFRLQFRVEIDPGSDDFWNREVMRRQGKDQKSVSLELEEERIIYTKEEATSILERLYRAGKYMCGYVHVCMFVYVCMYVCMYVFV